MLGSVSWQRARKRLQMKIWRFYFAFAFALERQIKSPRFSFAFAFVMIMLGTHKPQQQATLTKKKKIPEIFIRFRFRNSTERKSSIMGFLFLFACNCFCEDGNPPCRILRWGNPLRKILVSVKIFACDSGAGSGCAKFMGSLKNCVLSAGKPPCSWHSSFYGGGCFFFFSGGGVPILFSWVRGFFWPPPKKLEKRPSWGPLFLGTPRTMKGPRPSTNT